MRYVTLNRPAALRAFTRITPPAFSSLRPYLLPVHVDPRHLRYITHFGGRQC